MTSRTAPSHPDGIMWLSREDYERAFQQFCELAHSSSKKSVRIARFGQVGDPGISDLDLAVIADPKSLRAINLQFQKRRREDPVFEYVFAHDPVFLSEFIISDAQKLHTFFGLEMEEPSGMWDQLKIGSSGDNVWLYLFWHCFNFQNALDFLNSRVSLRLGCLIHKNCLTSLAQLKKDSTMSVSDRAREVRELALRFPKQGRLRLRKEFIDLLKETALAAFDYSSEHVPSYPRAEQKYLWIRRNLFAVPTEEFREPLIRRNGIHCVPLHPSLFSAVLAFSMMDERNESTADYIAANIRAQLFYREHRLPYPFITPFRIQSTHLGQRSIRTLFNRLASKHLYKP